MLLMKSPRVKTLPFTQTMRTMWTYEKIGKLLQKLPFIHRYTTHKNAVSLLLIIRELGS